MSITNGALAFYFKLNTMTTNIQIRAVFFMALIVCYKKFFLARLFTGLFYFQKFGMF